MSQAHIIVENRTVCGAQVPMQSFDGGRTWFRCDYTPIGTNVPAPAPERAMKTPIRGMVGHRQRVVGKRGFVRTGKMPEGQSLRQQYKHEGSGVHQPNGKGVPTHIGPLWPQATPGELAAKKLICAACSARMTLSTDARFFECSTCKIAVAACS